MTTLNRRSIFDAVRKMLGRGFSPGEVNRLDKAIDQAQQGRVTPDIPSQPELNEIPTGLGEAGKALIKRFEGCARLRSDGLVEAYPDPGTGNDPWTIGWGSTGPDRIHGGQIGPGTVWTKEQCDQRAEEDYVAYAKQVIVALGDAIEGTSQAQFDALVSFHYNTGAIARATLTKKHRSGDHRGAALEFRRWNKAGGRVMAGLTRRRAAEEKLYRSGM